MKKRIAIFMALSAAALALLVGCTTHMGNFTVISTRHIDWSRAHQFVRGSHVEGRDIMHIIVLIPTGTVTIPAAVENALRQVPGAVALVDVSIRQSSWYIPYIYGRGAIIVEGSVLVDPWLASVDMYSPIHLVFHAGLGGAMERREVCEAEFLSLLAN